MKQIVSTTCYQGSEACCLCFRSKAAFFAIKLIFSLNHLVCFIKIHYFTVFLLLREPTLVYFSLQHIPKEINLCLALKYDYLLQLS